MIVLLIVCLVAAVVLLICYYCYRVAFYVSPEYKRKPPEDVLPSGEDYLPYLDKMKAWIREVQAMPQEHFRITSFDGLTLYGRYFEYVPGAPIELMFPGYRSNGLADLSGGVKRCFACGHSCLLIDQRSSGNSDGKVVTFGINERRDCLAWVDFAADHFGPDVKLILTGVSIGAATVIMATEFPMPENVIGVLADCGYSSPEEIIKKTIREMNLPPNLSYPFVRLAARIFGRFDLSEASPVEAAKHSRLPIIFFHGENDDYVPCYMSRINYEACTSRKALVTIPGAGHGLAYPVAPEYYIEKMQEFFCDAPIC